MGRAQAGWAKGIFQTIAPGKYLEQLAGEEERRMLWRIYAQHDQAIAQWKETLKEVNRSGREFWEVREFQRIPGIGPMAAHIFSVIIEEPARFSIKHMLWKYDNMANSEPTGDQIRTWNK